MDSQSEWLIEFVHEYEDGFKVTKRGLDATPLVVRKFDLAPDEVMAFTCHQRANRAMTAFHFHPDFPVGSRRAYMRRHAEGHDLALSVGSTLAAERAERRRVFEDRIAGLGRGLALGLHSVLVYLAAGGPAPR